MIAALTRSRPARPLASSAPAAALRAGLAAMAMVAVGSASAWAADCRVPVAQSYLDSISRNPSVIFQNSSAGGQNLVFRVQSLATASIGSLRDIMRAAPRANATQKAAIGEGLGRAAAACITRYGEISRRITDAVRRLGDRDVTRSFSAVLMAEDEGAARKPEFPDNAQDDGRGRLNESSVPGSRGLSLDDPFKIP